MTGGATATGAGMGAGSTGLGDEVSAPRAPAAVSAPAVGREARAWPTLEGGSGALASDAVPAVAAALSDTAAVSACATDVVESGICVGVERSAGVACGADAPALFGRAVGVVVVGAASWGAGGPIQYRVVSNPKITNWPTMQPIRPAITYPRRRNARCGSGSMSISTSSSASRPCAAGWATRRSTRRSRCRTCSRGGELGISLCTGGGGVCGGIG